MLRLSERGNIDNINVGQNAINSLGLNTASGLRPSAIQRELLAKSEPITYTLQGDLNQVGITNRGVLSSYKTSQAIYPPMIDSTAELILRYTRPPDGKKSNYLRSAKRVAIGKEVLSKSEAVFSGRLY
mgnify:CR=1 FL=1